MISAPINPDEAERLAALHRYNILDTPDEAEFDDFTRLASQICETPIALISLVDSGRQWFKSKVGIDAPETPRDISFCGHAIHGTTVLNVPNALEDNRFHDNPLVTGGPEIRFYAGAPLLTADGYGIGTLCVIDSVPHNLTASQLDALQTLGRQVVRQLELRSAIRREHAHNIELTQLSTRLELATQSAHMGIWEYTFGDDQLAWDSIMCQIYGIVQSKLITTHATWQSSLHHEDRIRVLQDWEHALAHDQEFESEYRIIRPDGQQRWLKTNAIIQRDHQQQALRMIGASRDISERKRMEQMKQEFVSTVSHELRTPLTAISGSLGLIASGVVGTLPTQAKQMLDIAHKNSLRLAHLINDLLDMEKLTAGKMHFDMQVEALTPLLEQSMEAMQAYAEQYQVRFALNRQSINPRVRVDAGRLQQVISNFLSNAAKFSPPGEQIDIIVSQQQHMVRVEVIDRGPGIPLAFHGRIFQKFAQADSSDTRQKGGTGLGLSICKEIIERMNGQIGFDSAEGHGARFYFELPLWQAQGITLQTDNTTINTNPRLLVVEDEPDIALLLAMMLNRSGYQVDIAHDGETALNYLEQNNYAAMTLDLMLPDQNGVSLIREIRSLEKFSSLPIIVISAHIADGKLAINSEFHAIDWLEKPVDDASLNAAVARALVLHGTTRPRVLHVEDDADLRLIVAAIGSDVADFDIARSLSEARAKLAQEHYSLVILDIGLPDGSGWELLPQLKAMNPSPPVIVLSGTEPRELQNELITSALIKSRVSYQDLLDAIHHALADHSTIETQPPL
ncbi:response regulator [Sulfuriferula thiophila]|uniref:response regulator n=1 Tax=Sulfuriferula thiophila TaxID=1781211 RepID=UPI000F611F46|nr:response regulator [Sulfuriferula thiophila]